MMKLKWKKNKYGHRFPTIKFGKTLKVLHKQFKFVTNELGGAANDAQREFSNISESSFDEEPAEELMYAEGLVAELKRAAALKDLVEELECRIEDLESE